MAMMERTREAEAERRMRVAMTSGDAAEARLSDVFYDANDDDYGYDCDDLAAVLLPMLLLHIGSPADQPDDADNRQS